MNGVKTFFDSSYLNHRFLRSSGPLKIRLLQCYVVLSIYNIDAICMHSSIYQVYHSNHQNYFTDLNLNYTMVVVLLIKSYFIRR